MAKGGKKAKSKKKTSVRDLTAKDAKAVKGGAWYDIVGPQVGSQIKHK